MLPYPPCRDACDFSRGPGPCALTQLHSSSQGKGWTRVRHKPGEMHGFQTLV